MPIQTGSKRVSRRNMLQLLAAAGITGPGAAEFIAQVRNKELTTATLKTANAIIDQEFTDERLQIAAIALQRNLEQFQVVRDLEIDDSVEPAPIFNAGVRW